MVIKLNWRIVSIVLILLLVGSFGFNAWQYMGSQRFTEENASLKQQLASQAEELQTVETEKQQLGQQLNQTQSQVKELQGKIADLENKTAALQQQVQNMTSQVEKLREQLKLRDYTTIGLTFLWTADVSSRFANITDLSNVVQFMNHEWDPLHIYFFIYHAAEADWLPLQQGCGGTASWATRAKSMYSGNDIPIAIFPGPTLSGGSAGGLMPPAGGCAWVDAHVIAVAEYYADIATLTHELCHIFGFSDEDMGPLGYHPIYLIPSSWYGPLEAGAKWFQMPLPNNYEF